MGAPPSKVLLHSCGLISPLLWVCVLWVLGTDNLTSSGAITIKWDHSIKWKPVVSGTLPTPGTEFGAP